MLATDFSENLKQDIFLFGIVGNYVSEELPILLIKQSEERVPGSSDAILT